MAQSKVARPQHRPVNAHGRRIGESHPRATLTKHEIELVRELAEQGMPYLDIAAKFDRPAKR